jgi:tetratricopeptide (TPR) repeat protein
MAQEKMYKAALEAIDQGQTARARDLFTRLLRADSSKAEYWLWMSTLVESEQERIYCLESALRVDPTNEAAKRGLIILGARQADKDITPAPLIKRRWEKELEDVVEPRKPFFRQIWESPILRLVFLLLAAVVVGGVIIGSLYGLQPKAEPVAVYMVSPFPTRTPLPTISPTPTKTPVFRTPTATILGPTPLWMYLTETYTPIPLYVNTPHPAIEAYRAAIRSFENSNWTSMLGFIDQAVTAQPGEPDLYYYQGEAYRMLGNYQDAVIAYGLALKINPRFAPAYLGRALAYEKINPKADIEGELNYAIEYDPYLVDAYLTRARIRIIHNNPQGALDDLLIADALFPNHFMVFILRAQAYLELNDPLTAMQNAVIGFDLDKTSLPAYYTLALVYLANGDLTQALHYIDIYLVYIQDDAYGWSVKAQVEYQKGDLSKSLAACDQGITVDNEYAPLWYYRGLIHMDIEDYRTAVNDFVNAVTLNMLNFDYSAALGKALWADDRLTMSIRQYNSAETLAGTDYQKAVVYFYRAQVYEQAGNMTQARSDWGSLLALPPDQVPPEWYAIAQERWDFFNPPTATLTPTRTRMPTFTMTSTATLRASITPSPSNTPFYTPVVSRTPID